MPEGLSRVEASENESPRVDEGVFSSTYSSGEIQRPEKILLPPDAQKYFRIYVRKYIEEGKKEDCFLMADKSGDIIYVAQTTGKRISGVDGKLVNERSLILMETRNSETIGYGEVYKNLEDDNNLSVVGWTETKSDFRGQGLATRRLEILNALAEAIWGKPMRSGLFTEEENGHAERAWKRLVEQGKAEYVEKGNYYKFIEPKQ